MREDQLYAAVNATGFEIDVIRRAAKEGDQHLLRGSKYEEDFCAVQISTGSAFLDADYFEHAVVATSGHMAMVRTSTPARFVRVKEQLACPTATLSKRAKMHRKQ